MYQVNISAKQLFDKHSKTQLTTRLQTKIQHNLPWTPLFFYIGGDVEFW